MKPYLNPADMAGLTPGVLDEAAVEFFANGHCASMALALHRLTGWQIVRMRPLWTHAVVRCQYGRLLDARGPLPELDQWALSDLSPAAMLYAEEHLDLVMPFAKAVLERHFPDGITPFRLPQTLRGQQLAFPFARGWDYDF